MLKFWLNIFEKKKCKKMGVVLNVSFHPTILLHTWKTLYHLIMSNCIPRLSTCTSCNCKCEIKRNILRERVLMLANKDVLSIVYDTELPFPEKP